MSSWRDFALRGAFTCRAAGWDFEGLRTNFAELFRFRAN
jgi:hypothetical protein